MKRYNIYMLVSLMLFVFVGCSSKTNNKIESEGLFNSYKGLVMAGYQGWFNAPSDGADRSWYHYTGRQGFKPGSSAVEMWPDVSEYEITYETEFVMQDGTPARVFSSHDESTVDTHFGWMKKYGLDGVFMQRFVGEIARPSGKNHFNKVLGSAMKAANKHERAICVMYDLSGISSSGVDVLLNDIDEVANQFSIKDRVANPAYLYHNSKPLVAVWGAGFDDGRRYSLIDIERIVDNLKAKGFSVMLGVPTYWRELGEDTLDDTRLHTIIKKCDIVMPWFVGRYTDKTYAAFSPLVKKDIQWAKENDVDYVPLAFPGFSWQNLKKGDPFNVPRNKGGFLWDQMANALNMGAEALYIAMFDEIDEGTAIFKCAKEVPVGTEGSVFLPIEDGIESDHYLWLVGEANKMLKGKKPISLEIPTR